MRKGVGEFGIRVVLSAVVMIALQGCYDTSGGNAGGSDGDSDSDTDSDTDADTDNDTDTSVDCGGWLDETTGLCWQWTPDEYAQVWLYGNTIAYCLDLVDEGQDDWRMPTIDELRTLVRECPATMPGGSCQVTDGTDPSVYVVADCKCETLDSWVGVYHDPTLGYLGTLASAEYELESGDPIAWMIDFASGGIFIAPDAPGEDFGIAFLCVRDE